MDDIRREIRFFEQYIINKVDKDLTHNHVPVQGLVAGCRFCEQFGNVFEHGAIKADKKEYIFKEYLIYKK